MMGKGRAKNRHHTERKKARTRKILKRREADSPGFTTDKRVGKFTASHWGCQCWLCQNPRRVNKGKRSAELTRKELAADGGEE
jgi:hypothetical protein